MPGMQTSGQLQTRCSEHFPSGARGEAPLFCGLHRVREDDKLSTWLGDGEEGTASFLPGVKGQPTGDVLRTV